MNIKELTITFKLEPDVEAWGFLEHILLADGTNWPECLVGSQIVSDIIREATSEEQWAMGYWDAAAWELDDE